MRSTALIVLLAAGPSGCGSSYEQQQLERQERLRQVMGGYNYLYFENGGLTAVQH